MDCSMPGFPVLHYLSEFAQIHVHRVGHAMYPILCCLLLLPPSILPSFRVFSNDSALHIRWPKYWSFSISSSNEYLVMISFRIDWFDLLAAQGTLKSLLQHHYLKASVLRHSVFVVVQLWHPYMTTGKSRALTIETFVGKVMSLLFNMLSMFVIAFPPRSNCLFISWLQSLSEVISESRKIKSVTASTSSPSICHKMMRLGAIILIFLNVEFSPRFFSPLLPSSRGSLVPLRFWS